MSIVKKVTAVIAAAAVCVSCMAAMSACRTKDETVLTFKNGDKSYEVKAGTYLCFLMSSYDSFRSKYDSALQSSSKTTAKSFDYEDQKLDDKDYDAWIKENCYNSAAEYAFVEMECERLGIKVDDAQKATIEQTASQYWANMGDTYESNGVSYGTLKNMIINQDLKRSSLYSYYYGEVTDAEKKESPEKGSKRPSNKEIQKWLNENFLIADTLTFDFTKSDSTSNSTETVTDKEKEAGKKKLQALADKYNKGNVSFAEIYKEYNGKDITKSTEAKKPKDEYAQIFGSDKTGSSSSAYDFEDIKKQKLNNAVVLESSDGYMLVVKQDISKDSYYFDVLKETVVSYSQADAFGDWISSKAKELKCDKNESAVSYYKPQRIKEPTTVATTSSAT